MLCIWRLNGFLHSSPLIFAVNSIQGQKWYWPLWAPRLIKSNQHENYLKPFYNKTFNAAFTADEKAIIASNYSYNNIINGIHDRIYRTHVLYYDESYVSGRSQFSVNPFVLLAQRQYESDQMDTIQLLEVNSDLQLIAAVPYKKEVIQIVADDGYHILDIAGSFPLFSKEGESLFYVYEKAIRLQPLDLKEIYNLVIKEKLFGNPENEGDIWKVL
jgi:hypothetical protein